MNLSPDILRATYAYLRELPPFNRWKLPEASEVKFKLSAAGTSQSEIAYHHKANGRHEIGIAPRRISHLAPLLETMGHEMCHIRATDKGERSHHGRLFKKAAAQVCKIHGFDPKSF